MPPKANQDLSKIMQREDVQVDLQFKTREDNEEKVLRLHKERISFYVKDIGTYSFGFLFLLSIVTYCFWVLVSSASSADEKQRAWTAIWSVLGGVVGIFFGRVTK
jgi:hypothetical protein